MNILNPRKQTSAAHLNHGVLRKILPSGAKRDLKCLITQGPNFNPRDATKWDEHAYQEVLRFIAHDPMYYDPTEASVVFLAGEPEEGAFGSSPSLEFPVTFPVTFVGLDEETTINYEGSYSEFPRIVLTGPFEVARIENTATGEVLTLTYSLPAGRTVTIDTSYGHKTVLLDDGTSLLGYLSSNSDLGSFHIATSNGGVNALVASVEGGNSDSRIQLNYNTRYLGI
jgi:hypothetical protein